MSELSWKPTRCSKVAAATAARTVGIGQRIDRRRFVAGLADLLQDACAHSPAASRGARHAQHRLALGLARDSCRPRSSSTTWPTRLATTRLPPCTPALKKGSTTCARRARVAAHRKHVERRVRHHPVAALVAVGEQIGDRRGDVDRRRIRLFAGLNKVMSPVAAGMPTDRAGAAPHDRRRRPRVAPVREQADSTVRAAA